MTTVIQGASRGIDRALAKSYLEKTGSKILATCRNPDQAGELKGLLDQYGSDRMHIMQLDAADEDSIQKASLVAKEFGDGKIDVLWNVAGILEDKKHGVEPERRLDHIKSSALEYSLKVNTIGPVLMAKYFSPLLLEASKRIKQSVNQEVAGLPKIPAAMFLSARIGSIDDNKTGGWYSYRISKCALNAAVKGISIELGRRQIACVAVHPGTTNTDLTKSFLSSNYKLPVQEADDTAAKLLKICSEVTMDDNGKFLDYKREELPW